MFDYRSADLQNLEVTYISGVGSDQTLAPRTFGTWTGDGSNYGSQDTAFKFGDSHLAGTGATITYAFNPGSAWTAAEQGAFTSAMALWSAVANVHFQASATGADFTIARGSDGGADVSFTVQPVAVGGTQLGTPSNVQLSIDTSVYGFGPVGGAFNVAGGYPWLTIEHELGHVLGLGHAGEYNEGQGSTPAPYSSYDDRAASIMSYIDPPTSANNWTETSSTGAQVEGAPTTPMLLDILAAQRLYGLPQDTPLSGGQVFGFHSNIGGEIGQFFDFTVNTQPIVTLWDSGSGNVLDLSGFAQASNVSLTPATFTSAGGLTNNIMVAAGVRIDEAIGGAGADVMSSNPDGDTLFGGAGDDTLSGSYGADAIFGGVGADHLSGGPNAGSVVDSLYGGQGDDLLIGRGYLSGDLGNDTLSGEGTLVGGDGNDNIQTDEGSLIFGNKGDDVINAHGGSTMPTIYGGQGDDQITLSSDGYVSGDAGADTIMAGSVHPTVLGGDGDDIIHAGGGSVFGNAGADSIVLTGVTGTVFGGQGDDTIQVTSSFSYTGFGAYLSGDVGADTLTGSYGDDTLVGGAGGDVLTGGAGSNRFVYVALSDSAPGAPDRITDFDPGKDRVDISALDAARAASGQGAFHWVAAFDGGSGEAVVSYDSAANTTTLLLDADGDRAPDMAVLLSGSVAQGGWLVF